MYKNLVEVMLRRKRMVLIDKIEIKESNILSTNDKNGYMQYMTDEMKRTVIAATVGHNMSYLGYCPNKELMDLMIKDETVSEKVNAVIIPMLTELKGADVEYNPMYKNFPEEVMDMSCAELYINAILHYITYGNLMPESLKNERMPLKEDVKLRTIGIGLDSDCTSLFTNLLNSNTPFSPQDYDDIAVLSEYFDIYKAMPDFIVHRENMANLVKLLYNKETDSEKKVEVLYQFKSQVKSVTDVLRVAEAIFGNGNVLLTEKIQVAKVSRPARRALLSLMENCKNLAEDMKLNRKMWVRMGEILHPLEYAKKYPKTANAFDIIRDNKKIKQVKTYNAIAEKIMRSDNIIDLREFASEKQGVIARNLDRLLRNAKNPNEILDIYGNIATTVPPVLLWKVYAHFKRKVNEYDQDALRIFVIKGTVSKTKVVEDETKKIDKEYYEKVVEITENALKEIYKEKPVMGKVYIEPQIARCKAPNGTRDAQKGSISFAKGSRLPMEQNTKTVRAFIWWTNIGKDERENRWYDERVDLDLSAVMLDKDLKLVDRCSYYDLKGACYTHSGDITNGQAFDGKGVAEFIDIDIEKAKKKGVQYFAFTVNNYSMQPFSQLKHAHFGIMEREDAKKGEIFEPSTVKQKIKLNAPSLDEVICMFDIENREMIWMDEVGQDVFRGGCPINNADTNWKGTSMVCYKALHLEEPDIFDIIRINTEARNGELVSEKESADLVFALDEGITPTDLDYFMGELIPKEVAPEYLPDPIEETEETTKEVVSTEENVGTEEKIEKTETNE